MAKGSDFKAIKTICTNLESHLKASQKISLSEQDYLSLPARHAALVLQLSERCKELFAQGEADMLLKLGPKLDALKALDLSACTTGSNKGIVQLSTMYLGVNCMILTQ